MAVPAWLSPWLWVALTLVAASAQVLRNAAQRGLTDRLGTVGATHVRFLFGLPFGLLGIAIVATLGHPLPTPGLAWLAWTGAGALAQIAATALMLAANHGLEAVVRVLLEAGAELKGALMLASRAKHKDVAALLRAAKKSRTARR